MVPNIATRICALALASFCLVACGRADVDSSADAVSCDVDYAAVKAAEMVEISAGETIVGGLIVGEIAEEDLSDEQVATLTRWETILGNRNRPVDQNDLEILDEADAMLTGPKVWDRADDRECEPQDETFSLFCALYFASLDTTGLYQHRRTVMQEVRFVIEEVTNGREFDHRMMDYNNLPETSFADIKGVFGMVRQSIEERLQQQANCAL